RWLFLRCWLLRSLLSRLLGSSLLLRALLGGRLLGRRLLRSRCFLSRRFLGCGCCRAATRAVVDNRELGPDLDRFVFGHGDLAQRAGRRRRNLGVDLVGGDLEQWLVGVDLVAFLLQPTSNRAFGNALSEAGHRD